MASPKIQIKRGTVVPPYTLSTGELALNTTAKNLFVQTQTADTKVLGAVGSELVVANVVFTVGASVSNPGSSSGSSLIATFDIVTSGTTGYNARLFNVGTILKINNLTNSEFYVTSVTNATTFSVRQVGNAAGATALTAGTQLSSVQLYANSMTWIGAQIDTAISGTGTYDRLVSQKGITDYVAGITAGTVSLNEMGETTGTYYPVFADSTGSSVYRDVKQNDGSTAKTTSPTYNPNTGKFTANIFVGGLEGTVGASGTVTSGAFSTISASSTVSGDGFSNYVSTALSSPSAIGNTIANSGAFTTLSASSTVSGSGFTSRFAAPGPIGNTTPSTGAFTDLTTTGTTTHNGNFTVNGTQTYLNTTVMTVTDKNIELGFGVGTTGGAATGSYSNALIVFPSHSGTVSRIGTTGTKWKITFPNTTSIPVGIRPDTTLSSNITATNAGYLGTTATVTSITPTEIFYTAGGTPVQGTNIGLTVLNDYVANITLTTGSTANMVVGSVVTATGLTLTSATVGAINSSTVFVLVNRGLLSGTGMTAIATGAATDITADGGGITLKATTDKTLTWVSNTKNWTFNQGLETSSVDGNAGLTVNTFTSSTDSAMVGLVLSNYNSYTGGIAEKSPAIQFKYGTTASTNIGGYLLVTELSSFEFHNGTRGTPKFSVSSTGQVGDCTIDCGTYT